MGFNVATVKHASHGFDIDKEGTDSDRHRRAGASEVLVASARRWAIVHELDDGSPEPSLQAHLARLAPADIVLVEGYKSDAHPKIEAHRQETGHPLIAPNNPTIRAIASDAPLDTGGLPQLDLDDTPGIADFIQRELGL